jgi:endonuclease YncB( thermonuclease family)
MKRSICLLVIFFLFSVIVFSTAPAEMIGPCWVIEVKDGDSLKIRSPEGGPLDIRYMGVNAPELDDEARLGPVAKERNEDILGGGSVWLEVESSEPGWLTDRDGRVLAYVFLEETGEIPVQTELIREGLALLDLRGLIDRDLTSDAFPIRYADQLINAQIEAASSRSGLWALPGSFPDSELIIAAIEFWGYQETVWIINRGAVPIELAENWIFIDRHAIEHEGSRNVLKFSGPFGPSCILPAEGQLAINNGPDTPGNRRETCSGCGTDRPELWWFGYKVWDNEGDEASLFSPDGERCSRYYYPPLAPKEEEGD